MAESIITETMAALIHMTCIDCRFFERQDSTCRKYPPRLAPGWETKAKDGSVIPLAVWPLVAVDDWCGEFKEKLGHKETEPCPWSPTECSCEGGQ
ncbi:MAG: hypothetical protein ACXABY_30685 [Candidatus Thorarchaeota archaeon]